MPIEKELPPGEVPPEEVQESNALICKVFSEMFKPVLGPFGSMKLITKEITKDEVVDLVSKNAHSITKELKYDHPTADILINAGLTQGREVGDGITTVMVLIGELIDRAFKLKASGIHQNVIARGYERAMEKLKEILEETAFKVEISDEFLKNVAKTAIKRIDYWDEDKIAKIVVESIKRISDEFPIDVDDVAIVAETGRGVYETEFFDGVIVDREVLDELPKKVEEAKIALLDSPIEYKEPKSKVRKGGRQQDFVFKVKNPSSLKELFGTRTDIFGEIINAIKKSDANVLCCQQGIHEDALDMFRRARIMAVKRVKNTDMKRLEKSTGAEITKDVSDLSDKKLGVARRVMQKEMGGDKYLIFEKCPYKKSSAIIIRGALNRVLEGIIAEIRSALHCVAAVIEDCKVIPGGGAVEVECAHRLRKFANTLSSKEQIVVHSFADALESITTAIAKNSGMDVIDTLATLRKEHSEGNKNAGVSSKERKVKNMMEEGVIEPLRMKQHAFVCAILSAIAILKIDDLHIAKRKEDTRTEIEKKAPELRYKGGRIKY